MTLSNLLRKGNNKNQKFETIPLKDVGYPKKTKFRIPPDTKIMVKLANIKGRNFTWFQGRVIKFHPKTWAIQIRFDCTDNKPVIKRLQLRNPNHDNQRDTFLAKAVDINQEAKTINLHQLAFLKGYYDGVDEYYDMSEVRPLRDNNQVKELVFTYPIGVTWTIIR